jgi:hypothetical protein
VHTHIVLVHIVHIIGQQDCGPNDPQCDSADTWWMTKLVEIFFLFVAIVGVVLFVNWLRPRLAPKEEREANLRREKAIQGYYHDQRVKEARQKDDAAVEELAQRGASFYRSSDRAFRTWHRGMRKRNPRIATRVERRMREILSEATREQSGDG